MSAGHYIFFTFLLFLNCGHVMCQTDDVADTLQLVQILFRHGDRTVIPVTLYPNDPHFNVSYYPYGPGELTKKGKQTMYKVGKEIRNRYDKFLGPIYTPDIIDSFSSYDNRTKASLELVLAGLFPPTKEEIIESGLNWQPIPYYYVPKEEDDMFGSILHCPNFPKELASYVASKEFKEHVKPDLSILNYISKHTGKEYASYYDIIFIHSCLKVEEENGLELPGWTKKVYPEIMRNFSYKGYEMMVITPELAQITAGSFIEKIITNAKMKLDEKSVKKNRKIVLYSAHDITIAAFLNALKIFKPHNPSYGAYVMVELHKINETYGFKIYYRDNFSKIDFLKLPNCGEFCPLEEFISLTRQFIPAPGICGHKSGGAQVFSVSGLKSVYFIVLIIILIKSY